MYNNIFNMIKGKPKNFKYPMIVKEWINEQIRFHIKIKRYLPESFFKVSVQRWKLN